MPDGGGYRDQIVRVTVRIVNLTAVTVVVIAQVVLVAVVLVVQVVLTQTVSLVQWTSGNQAKILSVKVVLGREREVLQLQLIADRDRFQANLCRASPHHHHLVHHGIFLPRRR